MTRTSKPTSHGKFHPPGAGRPLGAEDVPAVHEETAPDDALTLAIKIDETVKRIRPDGWRGIEPRERVIKHALYNILPDVAEVERIFRIIKQQTEY